MFSDVGAYGPALFCTDDLWLCPQ